MGGFSKWNVLRDSELSDVMPEAFGGIPEVITGILQREAEAVWRKWNPVIWTVIKYRGCFDSVGVPERNLHLHAVPHQHGLLRRLLSLGINRHSV
jgi:tRNA(adenine34) deaminase